MIGVQQIIVIEEVEPLAAGHRQRQIAGPGATHRGAGGVVLQPRRQVREFDVDHAPSEVRAIFDDDDLDMRPGLPLHREQGLAQPFRTAVGAYEDRHQRLLIVLGRGEKGTLATQFEIPGGKARLEMRVGLDPAASKMRQQPQAAP